MTRLRAARSTLSQLVQRCFESSGKLLRRTGPPVVQEIDRRLGPRHVMMNRHNIQPIPAQRLEYRSDLRRQHSDITRDLRVRIAAEECLPRIQAHARVDRSAHFLQLQIVSTHADLVYSAVLLAIVSRHLSDLPSIDLSG